ncbi:methyltransferase [Pseudoxanthomonas sp. JBR18]|uniref:class I SAM-dependent methyltransferase n=1 Tax=Pseudoxanthomonas sp. JBR18 TaxID=2969308 RepID=UPI0023067E9F|nr:methyltransferase [Pseudoxanthomonas sp. JBR18]WCE03406.1 methyltransferase [Pseudoxanthomonas sp. JBR18]
MSGYQTLISHYDFGDQHLRIRALSDLQQFADPDALAETAGISSAQWSLFGHVWPAGELLAQAMASYAVAGKRVLELGCGLGLASLVLRARGADVVASDHHPLAEVFLAYNAALNGLDAVAYRRLDWLTGSQSMGRFDLIIGGDVLYERGPALALAALLPTLARPACEIIISDPGRGHAGVFTRELASHGFQLATPRLPSGKGGARLAQLLVYARGLVGTA